MRLYADTPWQRVEVLNGFRRAERANLTAAVRMACELRAEQCETEH
jgi:hypothetical protein